MTEKEGGSDVSGAMRTNARVDEIQDSGNERCSLYGYKWFSSATDADMTLTLARFPQNKDELLNNKGKIALVYVKIRDEANALNNIEVVRLKDKFGTR